MTALVVLAGAMLAGCAEAAVGPTVADARIGRPLGPNAALYMTLTGGDKADRLVGASTAFAGSVELHETVTNDDGTTGMRMMEGLDLAAGGTLTLEPGGNHLMLVDAERLEIGDMIEVTLRFEQTGAMVVIATVVDPTDTSGGG